MAAAASADVAVLVMGDRAGLTEACTSGESRDVSSLDLPGVQEELVLAVAATGTPVVLVLVAGRPIGSPEVHAAAGAVAIAWFPGEQGAAAIADVLVGDVSPGGRLPVSYPRSSGQIPVFYGHKVSGGRSHWRGPYVDLSNEPLYPFGHGLGYSTFELGVEVTRRRGGHGRRRCRGGRHRHQHRRTRGRRGGAALHLRPGGVGHPPGARAAGVPPPHARRRRRRPGDVPCCRSPPSVSPAPTCATSWRPATSSSSSARRPPPPIRRGVSSWRRRRGRRGARRPPTSRRWSGSEPAGRRQLGRQRHVRRHRRCPAAHRRRGAGGRRRRGPAGRTCARRRGAAQLHRGGRHRRSAGRHRRAPRGGRRRRDGGDGDRRRRHPLRRAGAVPRRARVGARSTCRRCPT